MVNTIENTPSHCHDCHAFEDCRQAQNMMADTPPEEGWVYDGEVYCADCLGRAAEGTLYEGESDSPTHCGGCGVPIIHDLTVEGIEYVRNNCGDGCCCEVWPTVWGIVPKIPVDSILIPADYIDLCEGWHGGQSCSLYAVSSTSGLTLGTLRPEGCDTEEKWYLTLWRELSSDVDFASRRACINRGIFKAHEDLPELAEFAIWIDEQVIRLEESYGLSDWDACDD